MYATEDDLLEPDGCNAILKFLIFRVESSASTAMLLSPLRKIEELEYLL